MSLAEGAAYAGPLYHHISLLEGRERKSRWFSAAERWSALEGEQLDEWQLYVEGREEAMVRWLGDEMVSLCCVGRGRSYGTFAGL
jgi:hypothetical protein